MSPDHREAAQALGEIARAERRTEAFDAYQRVGRALVVWGCVWAAGNASSACWPTLTGLIWTGAVATGIIASLAARADRRVEPRMLAAAAAGFGFLLLTSIILPPRSSADWNAFVSLLAASCLVLLGIWKGARFAAVGLFLAAFTLAGYFGLRAHFELWMAAVGGGALVVVGLWLQKL